MVLHLIARLLAVMRFGTISSDIYTTIQNYPGDMPEGTLRAILKQSGIVPEDFFRKK